jgi:hypothetical protein
VSVADEKVARVFEAPRSFVELAEGLGISKFTANEVCRCVFAEKQPDDLINSTFDPWELVFLHWACLTKHWKKVTVRPSSNALRFLRNLHQIATSQDNILDGTARRPPFEGELASITLWPEVEKIFGHGYEVLSM